MIPCKYCGLEFVKKKWHQVFCSEHCSAKYSNDGRPKVKRARENEICPTCRVNKKYYCARECHHCFETKRFKQGLDRTIEHMLWYRDENAKGSFCRIVAHARSVLKREGRMEICARCGQHLGLDVMHLWPLDRFPDSASLRIVNNPDNIEWRCHWHRR